MRKVAKPKKGYVYVFSISNDNYLVKIGYTEKHPEVRLYNLNRQTGVSYKFKNEWDWQVRDVKLAERILHSKFSDLWYDKEFYKLNDNYTLSNLIGDAEVYLKNEIIKRKIKKVTPIPKRTVKKKLSVKNRKQKSRLTKSKKEKISLIIESIRI